MGDAVRALERLLGTEVTPSEVPKGGVTASLRGLGFLFGQAGVPLLLPGWLRSERPLHPSGRLRMRM